MRPRTIFTVGFAALIVLAVTGAENGTRAASYLARCPIAGPAPLAAGSAPQGLAVTAAPPSQVGCAVRRLPIDPASVLAVAAAPRLPADAPEPQTATLTGEASVSGFDLRTAALAPRSINAPPPYLVPNADLRAVVSAHSIGFAGRVTLTPEDDYLALDCEPGDAPAGFAFATTRVPPIPGMTLRVLHTADQNFRLAVAPPDTPLSSETRLLAKLKTTESVTEAHVPLPADLPADTPLDFKVLCPSSGGRLVLNEIALEANTTVPPDRAAWIRDPATWQGDSARLFARAQRWSLTRLYIRVPATEAGLVDAQALAGFVTDASARGLAVWALLSDRSLIDGPSSADATHDTLVRQGAALADYNSGVPPEAQLKGVQIELAPELLWSYVSDPAAAAEVFLANLARAKLAIGMPLDAALPTWFPTAPPTADRLAATADSITVIVDRTDPVDIRRSAARFLAWGTRRGRPVQVALEAGPLPDSEQRRFVRASSGELWLVPIGGSDALILLKTAAAGLPGTGFRQEDAAPVPSADRTFFGHGAQLREVLTPIGRTLGAWPSFAGFAFHGLFFGKN